jgi:DNA-binding winged helix-turn-helix (wHTH) protein
MGASSFAFDDFVLDGDSQTLAFRDRRVPLTPKAFQTLHLLVASRGDVVEKEEFLSKVWPETFVEESTLTQNIRTLRKTLNTFSPQKEFIVTVPRLGYRFAETVVEVHPTANADEGE